MNPPDIGVARAKAVITAIYGKEITATPHIWCIEKKSIACLNTVRKMQLDQLTLKNNVAFYSRILKICA